MKKESSVLDFLNSTIGKVISIIISIYVIITLIPALLNAKNDLAVTIGVIAIISIIVCFIKYYENIKKWLKGE